MMDIPGYVNAKKIQYVHRHLFGLYQNEEQLDIHLISSLIM